jgi:tRNA A37 threonylcarbamoyladenosine synthetase subunit TsaC/SUA5/YrdC
MKFTLTWTSANAAGRRVIDDDESVDVETIAELRTLWEQQGRHSLIVDFDDIPIPSIEVYNDYRE